MAEVSLPSLEWLRKQLDTSIYRLFGEVEVAGAARGKGAGRRFAVGFGGALAGAAGPGGASGERRLALQPEQAAHVVDQVGKPDLGRRPGQADGSHEQP